MEFLVRIEFEIPTGTKASDVDARRAREASRARELARTGHLVRLWRAAPGDDRWANVGIWRADGESALRAILQTLPLYSWATIDIEQLSPHPNDPMPTSLPPASPE